MPWLGEKKEHLIEIGQRRNKSRSISYRLDLRRFGQGQLFFQTLKEAQTKRDAVEAQLAKHGEESLAVTEEERIRFAAARDKLRAVGGTIEQAVEFYLKHAKPKQQPITMFDLVMKCLLDKGLNGKRKRYLRQLKCSAISFCRAGHADTHARLVSQSDVTLWLSSNGWETKTRSVYLGERKRLRHAQPLRRRNASRRDE